MKMLASLPKAALYLARITLVAHPRITAQAPGVPEQALDIHPIGPDMVLEWESVVGRTYFLQVSGGLAPPGTGPALLIWAWADVIEEDHGGIISYEFGGDAPHGFARLYYTDESRPPGVSLEAWDLDGDGRSNAQEIRGIPQSNPLVFSSSGTGISDGWAVAHGLNPNDPSIGDLQFQQSGLTNLQAWQAGVQAHTNATLSNFDGDGLENDVDADPHDRLIDWKPGPRPAFAIIELPVENADELWLDDLTPNGTVLLSRVINTAVTERIVVDRNLNAKTYAPGSSPVNGAFAGYGNTLIGDEVPGFADIGGYSGEVLWDPVSDLYDPWEWEPLSFHDDIRDDRDGVTVWFGTNWPNLDATEGMRTWPGGGLLPDSEYEPFSTAARIERRGNIVSNFSYWRWDSQAEEYGPHVALPGFAWSNLRSATLERPTANPNQPDRWNLVATVSGLAISKNGGTFQKTTSYNSGNPAIADRVIGNTNVLGTTEQGWPWRETDGVTSLWANGEWEPLIDLLNDPSITQARIIEILDTGLALARIQRGVADPKIALLLPITLIDIQGDGDLDDRFIRGMDPVPLQGSEETAAAYCQRLNGYYQQVVPDAAIARIDPHRGLEDSPDMPQLVAEIPNGPNHLNVKWRLEVKYLRGNGYRTRHFTAAMGGDYAHLDERWGSDADRVRIPACLETAERSFTDSQLATERWEIHDDWEDEIEEAGFFGGTAELFVWFPDVHEDPPSRPVMTFRIGGKNPDPQIARAYIDASATGTDERLWFAYAIAKHETHGRNRENGQLRHYNQFYSEFRGQNQVIGDASHNVPHADMGWTGWAKGWPVYNLDRRRENGVRIQNGPGGYGVFQVTGNAQNSQAVIPRSQLWNWQDNVGGAMTIIEHKINWVDARYGALQQTYPASGAIPTYPLVAVNGRRRLSGWDAYVCTAYNGFRACPYIRIAGFTKRQATSWRPLANSWRFAPNSGNYCAGIYLMIEEIEQP